MKKFISLILIMIFGFTLLSADAAQKKKVKKPKIRTKVEIETKRFLSDTAHYVYQARNREERIFPSQSF